MPEAAWNTLLSGCFGLLTASVVLLLAQRWEKQKRREDRGSDESRWHTEREAEERRWYSDRLIERKFDAIGKLHAALVDCHFTLNFYLNVPATTLSEFKERIEPKEAMYLRALVMAEVYLNEQQNAKMHAALGTFRRAIRYLYLRLPDGAGVLRGPDFDQWDGFIENYEAAVAVLRELLNPELAASTAMLRPRGLGG